MGRPREHDDRTKLALLNAAEELLTRHGASSLSVRGVADAVGTTTRAVYSVFGSKEGLLEALAARLFEDLAAAIDKVPRTDDPVADLISASLNGFRRTALDHAALYGLAFQRVVPDLAFGPDFERVAGAAFRRLEDLIQRVAPTDPQLALTVHALTEGLAAIELRGGLGDPANAEVVWRSALGGLLGSAALTHLRPKHKKDTPPPRTRTAVRSGPTRQS